MGQYKLKIWLHGVGVLYVLTAAFRTRSSLCPFFSVSSSVRDLLTAQTSLTKRTWLRGLRLDLMKQKHFTAVCPNNNVVIGSTTHGWNEEFTKHITASAFQTKPTIRTVALQRFDPAAVHLVHTLTCNQSVKLQRPAAGSICTRPAAVICDVN